MARSMSASSSADGSDRFGPSGHHTPPWERQDIPRVPYMGPKSPGLDRIEHTDFSPWASHSRSERRPSINRSAGSHRQGSLDGGVPTASKTRNDCWDFNAPPLTAPPRPIAAPYHTPVWIPSAPPTAPLKHQYTVTARAPPSPPDSLNTSSAAASPPPAPPASALPGTMSSRERTPSRSRTRSSKRKGERNTERKHEKSESTSSFGSKFKSAFKDMFKRDPVDEGDFEQIQDRHWTEEDY